MQHVGFSYKIKRLIHSLRRYAWDTRQLMQELRQNQYGVMPGRASKLMGSVEKNADNMVRPPLTQTRRTHGHTHTPSATTTHTPIYTPTTRVFPLHCLHSFVASCLC